MLKMNVCEVYLFLHLLSSLQVYVRVNKEADHNEVIKQEAREFFKKLEQRESNAVSLWKRFRDITVDEYRHVYKVQAVWFLLWPDLNNCFQLLKRKLCCSG